MTDELKALLEKARRYKMTDEERHEQLISMAYGNAHFEDPSITKDEIRAAAERRERERRI